MSNFFLSIDPGVVYLGWAAWEDRVLRACGLSVAKSHWLGTRAAEHYDHLSHYLPCRVVCERMVTRGKFSAVDAQDLIDVNLVAGRLGTEFVTPDQWKGAVPPLVEQARTWEALTVYERTLLPRLPKSGKGNGSHVWSAVGIGLSDLGRAHRGLRKAA